MSKDLISRLERQFKLKRDEFQDPLELLKFEKNLDYARKLLWEEGKCQLDKVAEPQGLSKRIMDLQGRIYDLNVTMEKKLKIEEKKIKSKQEKEIAHALQSIQERELRERQQMSNVEASNAQLLTNQRSMQTEISESLLHLASVLKENALSFTNALVTDNQVVERTGSLLDKNAHSLRHANHGVQSYSKSKRLSFWLQLGMILAVVVSFIVMIFILQFTKNQN